MSMLTPSSNDSMQRLYDKINALEKRIATLERTPFKAPLTTGAPTQSSVDGSIAADTGNKIWLRVNGTWKSVAVA